MWANVEVLGVWLLHISSAASYGRAGERGPAVDESGAMEQPAASMSGALGGESGPLLV